MSRVRSILYHDVVASAAAFDSSGFPGEAAARYKLTAADFAMHLEAIARRLDAQPATFRAVVQRRPAATAMPFLITFDDGGASSMAIADALETHGWRGNFFITTDRIGTQAFVSAADVRDLDARGHGIGSHSASHPYRMAELDGASLNGEWQRSVDSLGGILGRPITDASVPGGFYAPRVAIAAARAGIRHLYTSEPTTRVAMVGDCTILGRFCVYRGMTGTHAAQLASGAPLQVAQQKVLWKAKAAVKTVAAPIWDRMRARKFAKSP